MLIDELARLHFQDKSLDLRMRQTGFSRFMDQKVTPDVLAFISDCIVNLSGNQAADFQFSIKDLWQFPYFEKNVVIYNKPSPRNKNAHSEYDKFIGQPLNALAFAGVLSRIKIGHTNYFRIENYNLLETVSRGERHSWLFLVHYIEKVLTDSGFINKFYEYRDKALENKVSARDFEMLKSSFIKFIRGNTLINQDVEIRRIFPKIINPLAAYYEVPGTEKGRMTKRNFMYTDLVYNRINFRDLAKDKRITRQEARVITIPTTDVSLLRYKVQKAKNTIKRYYSSSEVQDSLSNEKATQVHHIFPEHLFPEISDYLENLILLTPQQHNTRAHPDNKTALIDINYQEVCILSKIRSVQDSISAGQDLYSKESLIHVINVGLSLSLSTKLEFEEIKEEVKKYYSRDIA